MRIRGATRLSLALVLLTGAFLLIPRLAYTDTFDQGPPVMGAGLDLTKLAAPADLPEHRWDMF